MLCATALVLLMDASGSIADGDWRRQVEATARAIASEEVAHAIERGGPIAVTAYAFSDRPMRMTGWRVLRSQSEAAAWAGELLAAPRGPNTSTSIGLAISAAHEALREAPCAADRLVVDLSTDGDASEPEMAAARDAAAMDGVTINVISVGPGARIETLREHAATADGFLIHAADWDRYALLVRRKIILETAAR